MKDYSDTSYWNTRVAAKLYNDGITSENYDYVKACAILNNCVAPLMLKRMLRIHEHEIIEQIRIFETRKSEIS